MVKSIVLLVVFTCFLFLLLVGRVMAQAFDPMSANKLFPRGGDVSSSNEGSGLVIVCTSCASTPVNQTFRVTAFDDGTTDINQAYFEWVVFGATISSYSGSLQSSTNTTVGSNNRQYLKTQGVDTNESHITIQMDTHLPDTVWVAVRQSSEFGCTDGKWSVHLMKADDVNPTVDFSFFESWINSLVVVTPSVPFVVDLAAFDDSIHSDHSSTTVNVQPTASDNCTTVSMGYNRRDSGSFSGIFI